jgi:hypothetical protein
MSSMKTATGLLFWPSCAAVLAFATSTACGSSSSTTAGKEGNQAGASAAAGQSSVGGAAGLASSPMAGAASAGKGVGGGASAGAGPNDDDAGRAGAGGASSGGGTGAWDCLDAPPDLCYCNHPAAPSGTPTCSSGFECCFATAASCECAGQETCDVGIAQGAVSVKACPPS